MSLDPADTGNAGENIGSINVTIGADYSSLETAFDAAQDQAQQAGDAVANAFNTGAAGVSDAASVVANALAPITTAADDAAQALTPLADAATETGTAADAAAGCLGDLGDAAGATATDAADLAGALPDVADSAAEVSTSTDDAAISLGDLGAYMADAGSAADDFGGSAGDAAGAADDFSGSAGDAGDAATGLGADLPAAAAGAGAVGEGAKQAESSLAGMAEQMAALGEALIITEGLREFGQEALEAADNVTHASIALTVLTGDATAADETIRNMEDLGQSDGLAFPSLLTAATRMTALLPAGTDIKALMGEIADGAAVMGSSIDSASNRFDMIVNAGTLSARALTSLGLSLASVTAAMNQLTPAANVTEQNLSTMFKAMDPGQRVQVLQTALESLGGTASKVANETFGGQWQQLANSWDAVMVQVGQALLPVISDLTNFLKLDVAPFLEELASDFNALPTPVKDTAVAVGIFVAALVPITGIVAGLGLGLAGLKTALELVGIAGGEAAVGEDAAAVSAGKLGTAAATATIPVQGLASGLFNIGSGSTFFNEATIATGSTLGSVTTEATTAEKGISLFGVELADAAGVATTAGIGLAGLVTGSAAATFGFIDLTKSLSAAHAGIRQISDSDIPAYIAAIGAVKSGTGGVAGAVQQWQTNLTMLHGELGAGVISQAQYTEGLNNIVTAMAKVALSAPDAASQTKMFAQELAGLKQSLDANAISADFYALAVGRLTEAEKRVTGAGFAEYEQQAGISLHLVSDATGIATDHTTLLAQILADAKSKVVELTAGYTGAAGQAEALAAAQNKVTSAQTALNGAMSAASAAATPYSAMLDAIKNAASAGVAAIGGFSASTVSATDATTAANAQLAVAQEAYRDAATQVSLLSDQINQQQGALDAATKGSAAYYTAQQNLLAAQQALAAEYPKLATAQTAITKALQDGATYVDKFGIECINCGNSIKDVTDSIDKFGIETITFSGSINSAAAATAFGTDKFSLLSNAVGEAQDKLAKLSGEMQNGTNVSQQYEQETTKLVNAQIALAEHDAALNSGMSGLTTTYALLSVAVAEAKAKVEVLTTAYANNQATAQQLTAAKQALTTAENALTGAQGNGKTATDMQAAGYGTLLWAVEQATSGTNDYTTAANTAAAAAPALVAGLQSTAAAYQAVALAAQDAFSAEQQASINAGGFGGGVTGQELESMGTQTSPRPEPLAGQVQVGWTEKTTGQFGVDIEPVYQWPTFAAFQQYAASVGQIAVNDNGTWRLVSPTATSGASTGTSGTPAPTTQTPLPGGVVLAPGEGLGGVTLSPAPGGVTSLPVSGAPGQITSTLAGGTPPTATSASSGLDGGTYPDVTAHQSADEIWNVAMAQGGTISVSDALTASTASTTQALASATSAITTSSASSSAVAGALITLTAALGTVTSAVSASETSGQAVAGAIQALLPPGTVSSAPPVTGGGGTGYISSIIQAPAPATAYIPPAPVTNNTVGPTSVSITVNAASDPRETARQIAQLFKNLSPKFAVFSQ